MKGNGQIYILFILIDAYLAWVCVVVLPNRFKVLSNVMNVKRHSFFANMTEHSLAYDIVSGGDGVVAVSWLLACNLSFHFLFKCLVKSRYWYGT